MLNYLGELHAQQGRLEEARAHYDTALATLKQLQKSSKKFNVLVRTPRARARARAAHAGAVR